MRMKIFCTLIIIVAICLSFAAVFVGLSSQLPPKFLFQLVKLRDFFETALPVLAFGALIKFLWTHPYK